MREYHGNRGTRGNGFKNAVSSRGTVGNDSFLKQYMHIVYGPPLFFNVGWCLTYFRHSSLHIAFRESYTARDGNGRERLDIVRDGTGTVFNLIATRWNGTGMDLSQRDGTGLVMIFIPVSLSNGRRLQISLLGHDTDTLLICSAERVFTLCYCGRKRV